MNRQGRIIADIDRFIELFRPHCIDGETLDELRHLLGARDRWSRARGLFDRIRRKSLLAQRAGEPRLLAQYRFEEMCAKTLYNLSGAPAPFDADSPYWIVPDAMALARLIGVGDEEVLSIAAR